MYFSTEARRTLFQTILGSLLSNPRSAVDFWASATYLCGGDNRLSLGSTKTLKG